MNILNYFWGTTFGLKDTFDIETMIRFGHFDWSERPGESEIGYFLAQMNFRIEIYTQAVGDWDLYLDDPVVHQQKHGYTPYPLVNENHSHMISKKLRNHPNVSLYEDPTYDIPSIIRAHSDGKHMFLKEHHCTVHRIPAKIYGLRKMQTDPPIHPIVILKKN